MNVSRPKYNIWQEFNQFLDRFLTPLLKFYVLGTFGVMLAYFMINAVSRSTGDQFILFFSLVPRRFYAVWQWLTYAFIYVDPFQWLFHMIILFFFGTQIQRVLGTPRFIRYFLCAIVGAAAIRMFLIYLGIFLNFENASGDAFKPMLGAWAPLLAIQLAYAAYYPEHNIYLFGVVPVKAKFLVGGIVLFQVLVLLGGHPTVANGAQLSGILIGYVFLARVHREWDIRRWRLMDSSSGW